MKRLLAAILDPLFAIALGLAMAGCLLLALGLYP